MILFLLSAVIILPVFLNGSAIADEVKEVTAVKVQDPKRGSIPEMVYGYGTATPTSAATVTASFQRDGQVSDIFVEVGDQFKMGDPLLDFGASPAAVVAYEQAKTTKTLAERSLARQQQLFKLQLSTRDQLETAEKAVSDAQLTLDMFEKIGSIKPSEILTTPFDGVVRPALVSVVPLSASIAQLPQSVLYFAVVLVPAPVNIEAVTSQSPANLYSALAVA